MWVAKTAYRERRLQAAEVERDRLREAIERIAARRCTNAPPCAKLPEGSWICEKCIARAALAKEGAA